MNETIFLKKTELKRSNGQVYEKNAGKRKGCPAEIIGSESLLLQKWCLYYYFLILSNNTFKGNQSVLIKWLQRPRPH